MRYLIYILFSQILFLKSFAQGNFDKYGVNVEFIAEPNVTTINGGVQLFYNSSTDNNYKFKILARISRNDKGKSDQYGEFTWLRLKYVTNGNTYVIADELILYFVADGLNQSPYREHVIEIPSTIQTDGQIIGEFFNRNGATINEVKSINTPLITKIMSGPSVLCSEGIYNFGGPEQVSLENGANIATLTSLGNNQWKLTRNGSATGVVKLRSTSQGKTFDKEIVIGTPAPSISGASQINTVGEYDYVVSKSAANTITEYNLMLGGDVELIPVSETQFKIKVANPNTSGSTMVVKVRARETNSCGTSSYTIKNITLSGDM